MGWAKVKVLCCFLLFSFFPILLLLLSPNTACSSFHNSPVGRMGQKDGPCRCGVRPLTAERGEGEGGRGALSQRFYLFGAFLPNANGPVEPGTGSDRGVAQWSPWLVPFPLEGGRKKSEPQGCVTLALVCVLTAPQGSGKERSAFRSAPFGVVRGRLVKLSGTGHD